MSAKAVADQEGAAREAALRAMQEASAEGVSGKKGASTSRGPQGTKGVVVLPNDMSCMAVPETTSLFALLWRAHVIRHAHAASHVAPSDTAGEHDTPTPVLVRPRGRAPTSESGVREHTPHFRCSSRTTRTRTKIKTAKMTTNAAWVSRNRLH